MGIEILPPDVNESDHEFIVLDGAIRFGLDAVKGVGFSAVEAIKRGRDEGGPFSSLWDFCERVDGRTVNKKAIEALVKCGAFGSTGATRKGMLTVLEQAQAAGQKSQQDAQIGQGSIFDLTPPTPDQAASGNGAAAAFAAPSHPPIPTEEFEQAELLAVEKESIGLFVSAHPLKAVREAMRLRVDCTLAQLHDRRDGEWVNVGGIITQVKKIRTKRGDQMMFATLDDLEGSVEILVFGRVLAANEEALALDSVVLIRGRVDHKDAAKTCVVVQEANLFAPSEEEVERAREQARAIPVGPPPVRLRLDATVLPQSVIEDLKALISLHPGESDVVLDLQTSRGLRKLKLGPEYRVAATNAALRAELDHLLGAAMLDAVAA
jgi:DNA polymerase-3 subunit alpha